MKSNGVCATLGIPTGKVQLNKGEHINSGCCQGEKSRSAPDPRAWRSMGRPVNSREPLVEDYYFSLMEEGTLRTH